uniref:Mitochondrial glyco protein n=1 Tax=Moniliophthora roreri TaxID=221103 RepID=A0A0W0FR17_MONRR
MLTQEGGFIVDNVTYYRDTKLATELSAEADWKRRGIYLGPQFETLDVGLQEEIERWLNERGVNESIATFIPEYAEWKEQSEYVKWLEGVKGFIDQ